MDYNLANVSPASLSCISLTKVLMPVSSSPGILFLPFILWFFIFLVDGNICIFKKHFCQRNRIQVSWSILLLLCKDCIGYDVPASDPGYYFCILLLLDDGTEKRTGDFCNILGDPCSLQYLRWHHVNLY